MKFMGIDPGVSGGIAVVEESGAVVFAHRMPATERDVLDMIVGCGASKAALEFVRSSPQMGRVSVWTFGCGYGGLRMALIAARIPFDEVIPRKWQAAMGCLSGGDKGVTKRRAQELFPQIKVTHSVSDALLIAEYCRRFHLGLLWRA